jgi:hypothetical protein
MLSEAEAIRAAWADAAWAAIGREPVQWRSLFL